MLIDSLLSDEKAEYTIFYKPVKEKTERFRMEPALTNYIIKRNLKYALYIIDDYELNILLTEHKTGDSFPLSKEFLRLYEYDKILSKFKENMCFLSFRCLERGIGDFGNYLLLHKQYNKKIEKIVIDEDTEFQIAYRYYRNSVSKDRLTNEYSINKEYLNKILKDYELTVETSSYKYE